MEHLPTPKPSKPGTPRGFAALAPEVRREIARKGGASVPSEKRSFSQDRDLAAAAGRLGRRRPSASG
jgi:general stress protein YciG